MVPACHNSVDSVTVSGNAEQVERFVEELKKEDIFAKAVDSSGIPFHSPIMRKASISYLSDWLKLLKANSQREELGVFISNMIEQNHSAHFVFF